MHTKPFYKALRVLNIDQIREHSIALFIYKLTNCIFFSMFENMFISTSHDYSTRQAGLMSVQYMLLLKEYK